MATHSHYVLCFPPMADKLTPERRSWNMAQIRQKNTKPEIMVRSILHRLGYRFTLRRKDLPGHPDIVLPSLNSVVFVHGCFWHRHMACKDATTPKSKVDFWEKKFADNVARDSKKDHALKHLGWRVLVVWECQVYSNPADLARWLVKSLGGYRTSKPLLPIPEARELLRIAEAKADYKVIKRHKEHTVKD